MRSLLALLLFVCSYLFIVNQIKYRSVVRHCTLYFLQMADEKVVEVGREFN